MSDYLMRLANKALERSEIIRPRTLSTFEHPVEPTFSARSTSHPEGAPAPASHLDDVGTIRSDHPSVVEEPAGGVVYPAPFRPRVETSEPVHNSSNPVGESLVHIEEANPDEGRHAAPGVPTSRSTSEKREGAPERLKADAMPPQHEPPTAPIHERNEPAAPGETSAESSSSDVPNTVTAVPLASAPRVSSDPVAAIESIIEVFEGNADPSLVEGTVKGASVENERDNSKSGMDSADSLGRFRPVTTLSVPSGEEVSPTLTASKPLPPVRVTIGRVDVRAAAPPPVAAQELPPPPRPKLSLEDYLQDRRTGIR